MIRLISFIVLVAFLAFMLSPRLRAWLWVRAPMLILVAIALAGIALAVTGRLNWIFAAVGAALPMLWRVVGLLRFMPWIARLFGGAASAGGNAQEKPKQEPPQGKASNGRMTRAEAAEMLGVELNANRDEIMAAHRRLIQRLHPDRGGTDYLAARLNEARDCLIAGLKS